MSTYKFALALRFGDNDFHHTFVHLLEFFGSRLSEDPGLSTLTKAQWVTLINSLSFGFYLTYQNRFMYNQEEGRLSHTARYLAVTEDTVLIGEEAEALIREGWDNGGNYALVYTPHFHEAFAL